MNTVNRIASIAYPVAGAAILSAIPHVGEAKDPVRVLVCETGEICSIECSKPPLGTISKVGAIRILEMTGSHSLIEIYVSSNSYYKTVLVPSTALCEMTHMYEETPL